MNSNLVERYIQFQDQSPSPFHAVATIARRLHENGFQELSLGRTWEGLTQTHYYVIDRARKTVVAFIRGAQPPAESGFAIVAAHTDSPVLRLKVNPWSFGAATTQLITENHGSLIQRTWLDRPLILAGMVYSIERNADGAIKFDRNDVLPALKHRLVRTQKPIAVIPELAIHLDREKNLVGAINPETMLRAIIGPAGGNSLQDDLTHRLGLGAANEMDGFELTLAPYWPHTVVGLNDSFIVGPRHDDLAMVFCALEGLVGVDKSDRPRKTAVAAFFDAEETGSQTSGGAGSSFMRDVLDRIQRIFPGYRGTHLDQAMYRSFLISADMAHAFHPLYPDKHDETHRPVIGGGIVIKENASDRYATSGESLTICKALCEANHVPFQFFVARQDIGCGSTIGPIMASRLGCQTVDVGLPMWGMHSAAETMGTKDLDCAYTLFRSFYGSPTDIQEL